MPPVPAAPIAQSAPLTTPPAPTAAAGTGNSDSANSDAANCAVDISADSTPAPDCDVAVVAQTGSSGDVSISAQGGTSGNASAYGSGTGYPAGSTSAVATTGDGGAATVAAGSGGTGNVSAVSQCTITFNGADLTINGDLILSCYAMALAQSGASGSVSGSATGGSAGTAATGIFSTGPGSVDASLAGSGLGASSAVAGAGGAASAVGQSGATGSASASASCSFDVYLTHVVINGQLQLLCIVVATANSGQSGAVTITASGGAAGTAIAGTAIAGTGPAQAADPAQLLASSAIAAANAAAAMGTAATGHTGAVSAAVSCSSAVHLDGTIIRDGVVTECDGVHSAIAGTSGVIMVGATRGSVAPASTPTTGTLSSYLTSAGAVGDAQLSPASALTLYAATGSGGSATTSAISGSTGAAKATATCSVTVKATNTETAHSLLLACSASAIAISGQSGSVTAAAIGGNSGDARAGILIVTTGPDAPLPAVPAPGAGIDSAAPVTASDAASDQAIADFAGPSLTAAPKALLRAADADSQLAQTGSNAEELAVAGGSALMLGLSFLMAGRQRRRAPKHAGRALPAHTGL
jgi:hypothetical protein